MSVGELQDNRRAEAADELRQVQLERVRNRALELTEQAEQAALARRDAETRRHEDQLERFTVEYGARVEALRQLRDETREQAVRDQQDTAEFSAPPPAREEDVQPPRLYPEPADLAAAIAQLDQAYAQVAQLCAQVGSLGERLHAASAERARYRRGYDRLREILPGYALGADGWYRLTAMSLADYGAACKDAGL